MLNTLTEFGEDPLAIGVECWYQATACELTRLEFPSGEVAELLKVRLTAAIRVARSTCVPSVDEKHA
jgi:hypothetical protein